MIDSTYFIKKGSASVLVDGQFGSTGKGLFAAFIGKTFERGDLDFATTNAGPNSGHTVHLHAALKRVSYHIPWVAAVRGRRHQARIYLNAGSIIDPEILIKEIEALNVTPRLIHVHPHAAIVTPDDKLIENSPGSGPSLIASTQKGVGAALASKILREPDSVFIKAFEANEQLRKVCNVNVLNLNKEMQSNKTVFVEVSQGFSLSLNVSGFFPYTTSRDCTVGQALSDANIHPKYLNRVIMTMRTYPIRVGHLTDDKGKIIGNSGGCYKDQSETTWEEIGQTPEKTTVTGRVRRVFTWSHQQCVQAFYTNRPTDVFLNFCNYLKTEKQLIEILDSINGAADETKTPRPRVFYGFGPRHIDHVVLSYKQAAARIR